MSLMSTTETPPFQAGSSTLGSTGSPGCNPSSESTAMSWEIAHGSACRSCW